MIKAVKVIGITAIFIVNRTEVFLRSYKSGNRIISLEIILYKTYSSQS